MVRKQTLLSLCFITMTALSSMPIMAQNTSTSKDAPLSANEREELEQLRKEKRINSVWRSKYFKVDYIDQTLKSPADEVKSDWGVGYGINRAFYLHKNPIAGVAKIGIDFGCDVDFVKYQSDRSFDFGFKEEIVNNLLKTDKVNDMFQLDAIFGLGPSVKVAPFGYTKNFLNKLNAAAYWHFNAGVSMLKFSTENDFFEDAVMPAFSLGHTIGVSLSLNRLIVGYERRFASGKYMCKYDMDVYVNDIYDSYHSYSGEEKIKFESTTNRVFIGFNF